MAIVWENDVFLNKVDDNSSQCLQWKFTKVCNTFVHMHIYMQNSLKTVAFKSESVCDGVKGLTNERYDVWMFGANTTVNVQKSFPPSLSLCHTYSHTHTNTHLVSAVYEIQVVTAFHDLSILLRDSIALVNINKSLPFLLKLDVNKTQTFLP